MVEKRHGRAPPDEGNDMQPIKDAAAAFLSHERVAVIGVSREAGTHGTTPSTGACASGGTRSSR